MRLTYTMKRSALLTFFVLLALTAMTGRASAHAQLVSTDPHAGEVVRTAPTHVGLTFGEPVETSRDAVQVFDDHLRRVDRRSVSHPGGDSTRIAVALPGDLGRGTYTVSWHVSSEDTHPVAGSFRFSIG